MPVMLIKTALGAHLLLFHLHARALQMPKPFQLLCSSANWMKRTKFQTSKYHPNSDPVLIRTLMIWRKKCNKGRILSEASSKE